MVRRTVGVEEGSDSAVGGCGRCLGGYRWGLVECIGEGAGGGLGRRSADGTVEVVNWRSVGRG